MNQNASNPFQSTFLLLFKFLFFTKKQILAIKANDDKQMIQAGKNLDCGFYNIINPNEAIIKNQYHDVSNQTNLINKNLDKLNNLVNMKQTNISGQGNKKTTNTNNNDYIQNNTNFPIINNLFHDNRLNLDKIM